MRIWKYPLNALGGVTVHEMLSDDEIISASAQGAVIVIYARKGLGTKRKRAFAAVPTGDTNDFPDLKNIKFEYNRCIGTVQLRGFVFHIYEVECPQR